MYKYLLFLALSLSCVAAPPVTFPSNPNYYRYMPDENTPFKPPTISDGKIEERIRRNLIKWLRGGYEGRLKIEVNNGNVILYGFVPGKWDRDAIEQRVKSTEGVKSVNNQITVQTEMRTGSW